MCKAPKLFINGYLMILIDKNEKNTFLFCMQILPTQPNIELSSPCMPSASGATDGNVENIPNETGMVFLVFKCQNSSRAYIFADIKFRDLKFFEQILTN